MATAKKDYVAIAKASVTRPSKVQSYRRFLVYGRNKKGKSRFSISAGVEQTLVIDPEHGTDTMKQLNPYVWHVAKWEEIQNVLGGLRTGKLSPHLLGLGKSDTPFSWVAFDGMSKINNFALRYIMRKSEEVNLDRRPGMVDRRDYNKSGEMLKEFLTQAHALKINIVYTAQERMQTTDGDDDEGESSTYYVPDLPQGVRGSLNSLVEVIGRIYTTKITVKRGDDVLDVMQRRLWVAPHESFDTGYRSDFELPPFIRQPTIPKLTQLMLTGE